MFVGIRSEHKYGEYSLSLMNFKEAYWVVYFVKKILEEGKRQEDIGIVTPYRFKNIYTKDFDFKLLLCFNAVFPTRGP